MDWPDTWAWLETGAATGVRNMAVDVALLDLAGAQGTAVLRVYGWRAPTVSFGRHEAVRGAWDVAAVRAAGLEVVRRPTGGRALLHDAAVTWSVAMPLASTVPWRHAYDAVNRHLQQALVTLGAPVTLASDHDTSSSDGGVRPVAATDGATTTCFARPAAGELLLHGRKVAGSAVWRSRAAYLQHGVILLRDTQARLHRFASSVTHEGDEASGIGTSARGIGLAEVLSPAGGIDHLHARVCEALRAMWCASDSALVPPDALDRAADAAQDWLATPSWLWRR